eukprot:2052766-Rhodomonas_salina.3
MHEWLPVSGLYFAIGHAVHRSDTESRSNPALHVQCDQSELCSCESENGGHWRICVREEGVSAR